MASPSVLKGTRDFLPYQITRREYLFGTIREVYQKYGFLPIETPAMERSETLLGKYGEEGDRLIFKVLNNGDFMSGVDAGEASGAVAKKVSKRAMRYDLTVPFARFVAQHRNEIQFPFKRYQIQPVWRADRPQKGRYQEFFQCDADVVGSEALMYEVDFVLIFDEVLTKLGLDHIDIRINNRKILSGLAEINGCAEQFADMAVALDKLDKIGKEKVIEEWRKRGITDESILGLEKIFDLDEANPLEGLRQILSSSEIGMQGLEELSYIFSQVEKAGLRKAQLTLDVTLARGLDYYTGAIFEVLTDDHAIGSICGGGRYADLTSTFGLSDMSGVGISFGADRIYDVIEATEKWPPSLYTGPQVLFVNFGEEEEAFSLDCVRKLRQEGIASEVYPSAAKMKKQMKYAGDRGIPYVAMVGAEEMNNNELSLKNMASGEQEKIKVEQLITKLS